MIDCCVIRDLLPLYEDRELSAESMEQVRSHLEECPECREYYNHVHHVIRAMQDPNERSADGERYGELFRRIQRRRLAQCAAGALLMTGISCLLLRGLRQDNK